MSAPEVSGDDVPSGTLELDWSEVAVALFRLRGISTGLWRLGVRFNYAAVNAGPVKGEIYPSMIGSVQRIVLVPVTEPGPLVFDAGQVNPGSASAAPAKKAPAKKASAKKAPAKKAETR